MANTAFYARHGITTANTASVTVGTTVVNSTIVTVGNTIVNSTIVTVGNTTVNTRISQTTASIGANSTTAFLLVAANGNIGINTLTPTEKMVVTGNMAATGDLVSAFSDVRLKTNIINIDNALNKLERLNGVLYRPTEDAIQMGAADDLKERVGVLAHEVRAVLPQIVVAAPFDRGPDGESRTGQYFETVQYDKLIPLLIEAIKELSQKVRKLENGN